MRPIRSALTIAVALSISAPAMAEPLAGVYVRLTGGASILNDLDQTIEYNPALAFVAPPPDMQVVDAKTGYVAGGALGLRRSSGLRTEVEYRYQSNEIETVSFAGGGAPPAPISPDASVDAHLLFSNIAYEFAPSSRITPYVGAGVGAAWVRASSDVGVQTDYDLTVVYQGRAGVALALTDRARLAVEYNYTRTGELTFGPLAEDFTPTGPFAPSISGDDYASSSVLASIDLTF